MNKKENEETGEVQDQIKGHKTQIQKMDEKELNEQKESVLSDKMRIQRSI